MILRLDPIKEKLKRCKFNHSHRQRRVQRRGYWADASTIGIHIIRRLFSERSGSVEPSLEPAIKMTMFSQLLKMSANERFLCNSNQLNKTLGFNYHK